MIIDHICFAVREITEAIDYWNRVFGYNQMTEIVENSRQRVRVVFMFKEESITIKLIEPKPDNRSLMNFVNRGGGFHHLCFKCENIEKGITELTEKGMKLLLSPEPGEAFNNQKIAFLLGRYGLNIEMIDTDEKAYIL